MRTIPVRREWTVDDLGALPEDGLRYELVDGVLLVSPAPRVLHQPAQAELLCHGTRATDLTVKRHVLEQAGVASYWLLDPDAPCLTVLELVDGAYREVAVVTGEQAYDATLPFPVRVVPRRWWADSPVGPDQLLQAGRRRGGLLSPSTGDALPCAARSRSPGLDVLAELLVAIPRAMVGSRSWPRTPAVRGGAA